MIQPPLSVLVSCVPPLTSSSSPWSFVMEAEHEELSTNPFFVALLKHQDLVQHIAKEQAMVCVPSSDSLKLCKLTVDFLSTHILLATEEADSYQTRNGKTVLFSAGRVVCQTGFPRPRTVMVIYEELYYDEDFNTIKILRTNFPLEGKIPLAYYKNVATAASVDLHILNARTLPEHQSLLCRLSLSPSAAAALPSSFSPEQALANIGLAPSPAFAPLPTLPGVFISLARFIASFNTSYVLVKGFVDHAGTKVRDACERIKEELTVSMHASGSAESKSSGSVGGKMSRLTSMEASAAIEACMFAGIRQKLFSGLVELYKGEEARTQTLLASCGAIDMEELGVRPELVCEPVLAVQHLQQALNAAFAVTPLQKLSVLEDTTRLLTQAVDARMADARADADYNKEEKQDATLAADDMLPFWIYLLLQARPAYLHANIAFMEYFQPGNSLLNLQQLKVHLANMQGAVQFVDSGKLHGGAVDALPSDLRPELGGPRRSRTANSVIVTNSFADLSVRDSSHAHGPHAHSHQHHAGMTHSSSASSAVAASAATSGFGRRPSQSAKQLLESIEDGLNEIESSHSQRQSAADAAATASRSSAYPASSSSSSASSSHHPTHVRTELPATRSTGLSRSAASSLSYSSSASPAVAAAAASSVHRMGDFLAGLQKLDDGVTGRLGQSQSQQTRLQQQQQQPQQINPPRASGNAPRFIPAASGMLQLDDADLPPLIVQRITPATQRRY